jgi:hypothetical protein
MGLRIAHRYVALLTRHLWLKWLLLSLWLVITGSPKLWTVGVGVAVV